jgi:uncharacterized membrane protein YqjE
MSAPTAPRLDRPSNGSSDPRYEPDESVGELLCKVASDFGALLSSEVELAKVELREEAQHLGRAAGMLGAAALVAWFAVTLLSFAAAWGLAELFDSIPLGFLIVGVIYAVGAAVLFIQGRNRMRTVHPVPEATIASIKEDIQWLKRQAS